jgi:6-phosphofructokinase 1
VRSAQPIGHGGSGQKVGVGVAVEKESVGVGVVIQRRLRLVNVSARSCVATEFDDNTRMVTQSELQVSTLGECRYRSPLPMSTVPGDGVGDFTPADARVLFEIEFRAGNPPPDVAFEKAGAREMLFFDPAKTRAAIVTCGGLCPGLNNVIRSLFFQLSVNYGVKEVLGIRFGYEGLNSATGRPPVRLTGEMVEEIHHQGGTILGTSRGHQDPRVVVDFLVEEGIDVLFCVGGDGTMCGAHHFAAEVARRKLPIAIVGVPKTIDNDIQYCWRTFGFLTALAEAETVIDRAHTEAKSVVNGVGLVKVMGREAGFIAAGATIASGQVNFALVPEVPFTLDGPDGFLARLEKRLAAREHAVIVVAEGAGQDLLLDHQEGVDASGNRKLGDIGTFLKQRINEYFAQRKLPVSVKYFDPSYHIRSCPANTGDSLLCEQLARKATHAALAGKTDLLIGVWHNRFVHVPLVMSAGQKRKLHPESDWWINVLAMTGQERWASK